MREELILAHSVMAFENLNEVLAVLDQSIETHSKLIKRYEDRLGVLLRLARESNDPRLKSAGSQIPMPGMGGGDMEPRGGSNDKKKQDKKREQGNEEKGWIVLESEEHSLKLATGSEALIASNEISILFKIIETLKSKLPALESSRKLLSDLPAQGFRTDQRLRVVFKDGLPRYVLPTTEAKVENQKKFWYQESFRIAVLK
ncbi:MAG TPA: hypothetical protein VED17_10190 [Nitrososphaerales archaeon]|nr:hypothetical protein [Nitrososphaerales archaeon]